MNEPVSFPVFVVMRNGHIMPPGIHLHRANAEATAAREEGEVIPLVASPPAAQPSPETERDGEELPFMPTTDAAKPTLHMVNEALDGFNTMPPTEGLRAQIEHAVERAMWACPVFAPPSKSVWALVDKWREKSGEDGLHYVLKNALLNHSIELDEALLVAAAQEQKPDETQESYNADHWCPKVCPITGREFFMWLETEEGEYVPTYGGPYDSYTIPEREGEDWSCRGYDHDAGAWVEGWETTGLIVTRKSTASPIPASGGGLEKLRAWNERYPAGVEMSLGPAKRAERELDAILAELFPKAAPGETK